MRKIVILFLFSNYIGLKAQDLQNTEWFQIKAQRKDGSRILTLPHTHLHTIKYFFKKDSVLISTNDQYAKKLNYSVSDHILTIGKSQKFMIDTVNEIVLSLTEIPSKKLTDDRISSYDFVNSRFMFEYLRQTQQIKIFGDSLIESNDKFSPTFNGKLDSLFMVAFFPFDDKKISGTMIMDANGEIKSVALDPNKQFKEEDEEKMIDIFQSTSGSWNLPEKPEHLGFKIDFAVNFSQYANVYAIFIQFHSKDMSQFVDPELLGRIAVDAEYYFSKGLDFLKNDKTEKAIEQFNKSIEISPIFLDAYYDLVYAYRKTGNSKLLCETISKLKEMGQVPAEELYDKYCK